MAGSRNKRASDLIHGAFGACLERHPAAGKSVVIALSGGLDSMVLLDVASRYGRSAGLALRAVHVNHGLSPNAFRWETFCRRECRMRDVPFQSRRVRFEESTGEGLEAAARRARYAVLDNLPIGPVLLAHHRNDQAETVLFNLVRGAGVRGAAAMAEARGRYLRPFLKIAREDLASYAEDVRLAWVEDESNRDLRLSRNYLRLKVIPLLEDGFPAASANLAAAAARFREAEDLLNELAREDMGSANNGFPLDVRLLRQESEIRARNLLRYLLAQAGVGISSEERLREAVRQFRSAGADRHPAVRFGRSWLRLVRYRVILDQND